jgi:hypothetical protein
MPPFFIPVIAPPEGAIAGAAIADIAAGGITRRGRIVGFIIGIINS